MCHSYCLTVFLVDTCNCMHSAIKARTFIQYIYNSYPSFYYLSKLDLKKSIIGLFNSIDF